MGGKKAELQNSTIFFFPREAFKVTDFVISKMKGGIPSKSFRFDKKNEILK